MYPEKFRSKKASAYYLSIAAKAPVFGLAGLTVLIVSFYAPVGALFFQKNNVQNAISDYLYDSIFWHSLMVTFRISFWTAAACTLLATPVALYIAHASLRTERLFLALITSALFTSILLRSVAWLAILGQEGPVSRLIAALSISPKPFTTSLLFNSFTVELAMVHILLPTAILALWSQMRVMSREHRRYADLLGSPFWYYVVKICLPINSNTISRTFCVIFVLSSGFYITPLLLGGGGSDTLMIGILIDEQINRFGNWTRGAALAVLLGVAMAFFVGICDLLSRILRLLRRYV